MTNKTISYTVAYFGLLFTTVFLGLMIMSPGSSAAEQFARSRTDRNAAGWVESEVNTAIDTI